MDGSNVKDDILLTGRTSVFLIMNMRRFVNDASAPMFEKLRGTAAFLSVLREIWPRKLARHGFFVVSDGTTEAAAPGSESGQAVAAERLSSADIGFLTGVFRQYAVENFATPTYRLVDKHHIPIPTAIQKNVQYMGLFAEPWNKWEISIRPTVSGMFIVRLDRIYRQPKPLLSVAADVARLQMAFDIPSARQKYFALSQEGDSSAEIDERRESINALLRWLGTTVAAQSGVDFVPVQWKMALEICTQFVRDIGERILVEHGTEIELEVGDANLSGPLHDSYVLYHVDTLIAPLALVKGVGLTEASLADVVTTEQSPKTLSQKIKIQVGTDAIRQSGHLKQQLSGLIEGAILRKENPGGTRRSSPRTSFYFPNHNPSYVAGVMEKNIATWKDELCILTRRAAVLMPSQKAKGRELLMGNFSVTKDRIYYEQYWQAVEKMVEFALEVRVFAQILERSSAELLRDFEDELRQIREEMLQRNIQLRELRLRGLADRVANISRLISIGRSLSAPSIWSRAEFAVDKANRLLHEQDVQLLFGLAERNVANLNELLTHIDELYLADLSERRNDLADKTSGVLVALSLLITVYAIPSFWSDSGYLEQEGLVKTPSPNLLVTMSEGLIDWLSTMLIGSHNLVMLLLVLFGDILALAVVGYSLYLIIVRYLSSWFPRFHRRIERQELKTLERLDEDK